MAFIPSNLISFVRLYLKEIILQKQNVIEINIFITELVTIVNLKKAAEIAKLPNSKHLFTWWVNDRFVNDTLINKILSST